MNYELFTFHQIFHQALDNDQTTDTGIEELETDIKQESDRILIALQNSIISQDPPKAQQYIQQHQQALQIILEDLDKAQSTEEGNKTESRKQIRKIFRNTSEKLLIQLQKYFPAHFNHQFKLPISLLEKTIKDFEQKTAHLIEALTDRKNSKQPITNIEDILHSVLTLHQSLTYHQKAYMESFLEELTTKIKQAENGTGTMDILIHIISSNYNHPLFYNFCCQYFCQEI